MTYEDKLRKVEEHGWVEYYHDNCIKREWIEQSLPYDRMGVSLDRVYEQVMEKENYPVKIIKDLS